MGIGQLHLQLGFPSAAAIAVTTAGIAEDEELSGVWIAEQSLLAPPMCDGVSREGGGVMGNADHDGASIGEQIIDTVRHGDAGGIGAEVVIAGLRIPQSCCASPSSMSRLSRTTWGNTAGRPRRSIGWALMIQ